MQSDILTVSELAEYLKLSRAKVYQMAQRGELPGTKLGTHWRFRKDLIDLWLEEQMSLNRQPIQAHLPD
ncbi:MAG: helix-turn-helix domain-containing protein [Chloroflexota bacterium]